MFTIQVLAWTLSNSLKEYFDKLNLRAEGSKGISFGTVNERSPRTAANEIVNGDAVIVNGHSQQTSSHKSSKSTKNKSSHNNNNSNSSQHEQHQQPKMSSSEKKEQQKTAAATNSTIDPEAAATSSTTASGAAEEAKKSEEAVLNAVPQESSNAPQSVPETNGSAHTDNAADDVELPLPRQRRISADDSPTETLSTFTSRRSRKYQDPAIIFPDVDGIACYEKILEVVGQNLTSEEKHSMKELHEYLTCPEGGAWALGTPHLDAIGRLLNDRNFPDEIPILALQLLQAIALKDDVILLLHQDREHHYIMSYMYGIEKLPVCQQVEVTTFMCNLCSNTSSFDWLMYISEWDEDGKPCSNGKVTVRVAVHSLLSDASKVLQERATALIYNLALKELFDDVATEISMAILQYLHGNIGEEMVFRCLTALQRFMVISYNELPALMKMLGPDVRNFSNMSERVKQLADEINTKLSVIIIP